MTFPLPALARLNAWARLPWAEQMDMHDLPHAIYRYKGEIIRQATAAGAASHRLIAVERPCKTCKGTGTYEWQNWHDEDDVRYEACRRCGATGKVILRFVETTIEGFRFHSPRPKWTLGIFTEAEWEAAPLQDDWQPEQPGAPMDRLELIGAINEVERFILGDRIIPLRKWVTSDHESINYALHLGTVENCWCCGAVPENPRWWGRDIYRPGLRFKADICQRCREAMLWAAKPYQWPRNLDHRQQRDTDYPEWHSRVPLPYLAHHSAVIEWTARRGIVIGAFPPGEYAWLPNTDPCEVHHTQGDTSWVRLANEDGFLGTGYGDKLLIPVRSKDLYVGRAGCPWTKTEAAEL